MHACGRTRTPHLPWLLHIRLKRVPEDVTVLRVQEPVASASGGASAGAAGMCTGTCEYRVTGDMVWSAATHPVDYPSGLAHWSPFYVVTHDDTCAPVSPLLPCMPIMHSRVDVVMAVRIHPPCYHPYDLDTCTTVYLYEGL